MQRIINDPTRVVEDMLQGYVKAHSRLVARTENPRVLKYAPAPIADKVGIVTGGGSGHKPAFIGYIGKNLCDAVAVGEIFTSLEMMGITITLMKVDEELKPLIDLEASSMGLTQL